jgi:hypothetical protein
MEAFGGIEAFQKSMNEHASWMYREKEAKEWVNGKPVTYPPAIILLNEKVKLILSVPVIDYDGKDLYHYNRVITIKNATRDDRAEALCGREVKESIEIEQNTPNNRLAPPQIIIPIQTSAPTPVPIISPKATTAQPEQSSTAKKERQTTAPNTPDQDGDRRRFIITPTCPACGNKLVPRRGIYCQTCGHKLPPGIAVHQELVVSVKVEDYNRLATHLKQKIGVSWVHMLKGRKLEKVSSQGQNIFIITVEDEMRSSTVKEEERLDELLIETSVGRVTSDPYELQEARKMLHSEQNKSAD